MDAPRCPRRGRSLRGRPRRSRHRPRRHHRHPAREPPRDPLHVVRGEPARRDRDAAQPDLHSTRARRRAPPGVAAHPRGRRRAAQQLHRRRERRVPVDERRLTGRPRARRIQRPARSRLTGRCRRAPCDVGNDRRPEGGDADAPHVHAHGRSVPLVGRPDRSRSVSLPAAALPHQCAGVFDDGLPRVWCRARASSALLRLALLGRRAPPRRHARERRRRDAPHPARCRAASERSRAHAP